jgi:hypothetical protein
MVPAAFVATFLVAASAWLPARPVVEEVPICGPCTTACTTCTTCSASCYVFDDCGTLTYKASVTCGGKWLGSGQICVRPGDSNSVDVTITDPNYGSCTVTGQPTTGNTWGSITTCSDLTCSC